MSFLAHVRCRNFKQLAGKQSAYDLVWTLYCLGRCVLCRMSPLGQKRKSSKRAQRVRFSLKSGHGEGKPTCPLRATSGHSSFRLSPIRPCALEIAGVPAKQRSRRDRRLRVRFSEYDDDVRKDQRQAPEPIGALRTGIDRIHCCHSQMRGWAPCEEIASGMTCKKLMAGASPAIAIEHS
jgi:hypothetical protein